jgi:hypothetical protein
MFGWNGLVNSIYKLLICRQTWIKARLSGTEGTILAEDTSPWNVDSWLCNILYQFWNTVNSLLTCQQVKKLYVGFTSPSQPKIWIKE